MKKMLRIRAEYLIEDPNYSDVESIKWAVERGIASNTISEVLWGIGTYIDSEVVSIKYEEEYDARA